MTRFVNLFVALLVVFTLAVAPVAGAASPASGVTPHVWCAAIQAHQETPVWYWAHFGYTSTSKKVVTIRYGENNKLLSNVGIIYGQPRDFYFGSHDEIFSVYTDGPVSWTLGDKTVTASIESPACK